MDPDVGGLIEWSATLAAEAAVDLREEWDPLDLRADAIDLIRGRARSRRNLQRNVGTATHEAVEALTVQEVQAGVLPVSVAASVLPYVRVWEDWKEECGITFTETEVTLVNRQVGYAGTADAIGMVPQVGTVLVDYKTGKSIRRKDHGQLALLACAEAILRDDGTEEEWLGVDVLWIVQLRPEGWTIHEVPWGGRDDVRRASMLAVALVAVRTVADELEASVAIRTAPEALA
jgi:hypothetical protein